MRLWERRVKEEQEAWAAKGVRFFQTREEQAAAGGGGIVVALVKPPEDRDVPAFAVVMVNLRPDVARKHCRNCVPSTVDGKDVLRGEVLLEGLTWDDAYDQALILRDAREILGS